MKNLKMKFVGLLLVVVATALQSKVYATNEQQKAVVVTIQAGDTSTGSVTDLHSPVAMPEVAALPDQSLESAGGSLYAQNATPDQLNDASTTSVADDPVIVVNDSLPPGDASTSSTTILNILKTNWAELLLGLLAFIKILVRLTPTLKDDAVFGRIDNLLNAFVPNFQMKKKSA